ncbi:MAG: suppressor of fused domain protein [Corynebacterium sp.]|nr:suppressor of fused domain protein [Corynebacterium sp.]
MDLKETSYWLSQLFPPVMGIYKAGTFHIAQFDLDGEYACATADFSQVEFGMETEGPDGRKVDVRPEIMTLGYPEFNLVQLLNDTATLLTLSHGALLPQPGTVIRGITAEYNACNGILIAPYVWEQGVPQMYEEPGKVGSDRPTDQTRGRLTLLVQLLLLTDEELEFGLTNGMPALQEELERRGVDLLDLNRETYERIG